MKSKPFLFLLVLTLLSNAEAQVLCVSDKPFYYPEIWNRAGLEPTIVVHFDVIGFSAQNITFEGEPGESFRQSVTENLKQLIYLKDTTNFKLTIQYLRRPTISLSRGYAELVTPNELHVVARKSVVQKTVNGPQKIDPTLDTAVVHSLVEYKSGPARPSDILVRRLFVGDRDSTLIVRNNYPDLEEDILSRARSYSKDRFLGFAPNARVFLVRFRVRRIVEECDCKAVF